MAFAYPRADLDPPAARNLVQVERPCPIQDPKVNRVLARLRQAFEIRARYPGQRHVLLSPKTQFQQLWTEAVAFSRDEIEISALDQGGRQPMRCASGDAQRGRK